ncbi:response regulator [Dyadobacter chenwenxiniae]|uniref:Response regulator n=1 Tax=Dyadobacter chenwenxiniae TaxID=2906456 RepID=A0A9X1TF33_9BACT|nr:response regulator [Dyadobacter chenwenxiniae]MCF0062652.1 response regulator [Dyadobacter chenwenxiniae]UON83604.1 response regulator [Dyadobacter chenwenxiniae]
MEKSDKKTILVVDDNQDAAYTTGMFLELQGYNVHTRYSGQGALEAVKALHPDLVILDLAMPVMDGYQTATQLRASYGATLPLIALSGYGQQEDKRMSSQAGFNAHMVKPVDFIALIELLKSFLSNQPAN